MLGMLISRDVMKSSTDRTILRAAVFSNLADDDDKLIRRLSSLPLSDLKEDFYRSCTVSVVYFLKLVYQLTGR